jgi:hypothetical protein
VHRSGSLVVSVDYGGRRAPIPAALEVLRRGAVVRRPCGRDGGDLASRGRRRWRRGTWQRPRLRFAMSGPALALQVLIYPYNCAFDTASYHQYAAG